jgi:hypothetical protein
MGYAIAMSPCIGCRRVFSYNPVKVPSLRINGSLEPVCMECVKRANPQRVANGLAPITVLPGAYEPCDEDEL